MIIYYKVIDLDFKRMQDLFRGIFTDQNMTISSVHWTMEKQQLFLVRMSQKRCLSRRKWEEKLRIDASKPSLIPYERNHFSDLLNTLENHWP